MKKYLPLLTSMLCLSLTPAFAQFGRTPGGPDFSGATAKLFGDNSAFTAIMEMQSEQKSGEKITMPGKIFFDAGMSRFEMNMSDAKGMKMSANTSAQMKSMGMDTMISISRPDKKLSYLIYPGLHSYLAMTPPAKTTGTANDDYKITTTDLGKETVDGHVCVKNKVVMTDKEGTAHTFTIWNATDLKNFPVQIMTTEKGASSTMLFRNISLEKPDAGTFEPPADFTKYDNMQTMMQTEMMKKMGGGMGMPAGR